MDFFIPIITIAFAQVLATLMPGPNFFISVKQGLSCSRDTSFYTVAGIGVGNFIHIVLGFLGLSAIIAQSIWLYSILKYLGAAYLVFLGIKALFVKQKDPGPDFNQAVSDDHMSYIQAFRLGLFTCLSNPKAVVYYLALFTTIVPPDTTLAAKLIMIVLLPLISGTWHSFVVVSLGNKQARQFYSNFQKWINTVFGSLMIFIGLKIALSER